MVNQLLCWCKICKLYIIFEPSAATPHPYTSAFFPTRQPPLPSSEKGNHSFFLTVVSLSYCLYISICDRYVTLQQLKVFYEFGTVYESLWELRKWFGSHGPNGCHAHIWKKPLNIFYSSIRPCYLVCIAL